MSEAALNPRPNRRPLILVADDDDDILALVEVRLELAGYDVITARSGDEALRMALEHSPDLAVVDVMMPGLDGYELTRELRRREATSEMPVILLTARAQESDVAEGLGAGADDYVKKPFDAKDLRARVGRLLA